MRILLIFSYIFIFSPILKLYGQEDNTKDKISFKSLITDQKRNNFSLGETLNYNIKFSIFGVGKATISIDTAIYIVNDKPSYKLDILAKNRAYTRIFAKIDEIIGGYIDTNYFRTVKSYKYIRENTYQRDEVAIYDYKKSNIKVYAMSNGKQVFDKGETFPLLPNSYDVTTMIMRFRSQNFDTLQRNDVLIGNCFFENIDYQIYLYYQGKKTLKTPLGKVRSHVFKAKVQNTKFLKESEEPIHTIWISDDKNHIPLRIETKTVYGNIKIILQKAKHLKYPFTAHTKYNKKYKNKN